jgi:hypothetical protein
MIELATVFLARNVAHTLLGPVVLLCMRTIH